MREYKINGATVRVHDATTTTPEERTKRLEEATIKLMKELYKKGA